MAHDTLAFRTRYRAGISPWYNPWLHGGFMLAFGFASIWFFSRSLDAVLPVEWLTVLVTVVLFNLGEYTVHKELGHVKRPLAALFYRRHTGDHHSFFVEGQMVYETPQDWRVILFPPWLVVVYSAGVGAAWVLLSGLNQNVASLFAVTLLAGYISYETLHVCEHLPVDHWIARLPGIRQMHRLHALHHRRDLMHTHNFNIVLPLMDGVMGTLHWEPVEDDIDIAASTVMRHDVKIAGNPQQVLAYASTATRWPEWHPSSLQVDGMAGPMLAGTRFEERIHAGGAAGHLRWEVLDNTPGVRWQARAWGQHGLKLLVTYEVEPCASGTHFVRTLHYELPGVFLKLLDVLLLRKRIAYESELSMAQLRMACHHSDQLASNV